MKTIVMSVLIFTLSLTQRLVAQDFKKEKRIYVLDVTKSMFGLNGTPNIFEDVKKSLYTGIENISDLETEITIITFQGTSNPNLPTWTFKKGDGMFEREVKKTIDSYTIETVPGQNTDIYSALKRAQQEVDPSKINYIYLLTDGGQSPVGGSVRYGENDLIKLLDTWCEWANMHDSYLFYVMLTSGAEENNRISSVVQEECRAFISRGTNVNIAFIKPADKAMVINLEDEPEFIEVPLLANDWRYIPDNISLTLNLEANNIFQLKSNKVKIKDRKLIIQLKRYNNMDWQELRNNTPVNNNSLTLTISSSDNDIKILNPVIDVKVKNEKEKVLTLEFVE
jgi:hypothetical protein